MSYIVLLQIWVVLLDAIVQYRDHDTLAGHAVTPGPPYSHVQAIISRLLNVTMATVKFQEHGYHDNKWVNQSAS